MKKILLYIFFSCFIFGLFAQKNDASFYYKKGYTSIDKRAFKDAIKYFNQAIKADSTGDCGTGVKGKAYGELGYSQMCTGDTASAILNFKKAIEYDKSNPYPRQNLAVIYSIRKKYDDAFEELNKLIANNPDFIDAYIQRGFYTVP